MTDELERKRREREANREQRERDLDDMFVRVAVDVIGPSGGRALRDGLNVLRSGGTEAEADAAIHKHYR